jgi:hypothetical protein
MQIVLTLMGSSLNTWLIACTYIKIGWGVDVAVNCILAVCGDKEDEGNNIERSAINIRGTALPVPARYR